MVEKQKPTDVFLITKKFKTSSQFSQFIEKEAVLSKSSCIDILIDYCVKNDIEIESVNKLLSSSLKQKLEVEAQDLNLLKVKSVIRSISLADAHKLMVTVLALPDTESVYAALNAAFKEAGLSRMLKPVLPAKG